MTPPDPRFGGQSANIDIRYTMGVPPLANSGRWGQYAKYGQSGLYCTLGAAWDWGSRPNIPISHFA